MKRQIHRALAMLLVMVSLFSLFGCGGNEQAPVVQEGILISPEDAVPYSEETLAYAEETFYSLLTYYTKKKNNLSSVPQATQTRLRSVATSVMQISSEQRTAETAYLAALQAIESMGASVVDELLLYDREGLASGACARDLYASLLRNLGADILLPMLYRLLVYSYDYRYSDAMEKYHKYNYTMHLNQANALQAEREIIVNEIGSDAFCSVLGQAVIFGDLLLGGVSDSNQIASFSDAEIFVFLRSLDISAVQISHRGWELLLKKVLPTEVAAEADDYLRLVACIAEHDLAALADAMNDISILMAASAAHLTAEDISAIRNGDAIGAFYNVMRKFSDEECASLSRIGAISLEASAYDDLAVEMYGEAYLAYAEGLAPITAQQLLQSADAESFYEGLERFVGGILPAISYGMKK